MRLCTGIQLLLLHSAHWRQIADLFAGAGYGSIQLKSHWLRDAGSVLKGQDGHHVRVVPPLAAAATNPSRVLPAADDLRLKYQIQQREHDKQLHMLKLISLHVPERTQWKALTSSYHGSWYHCSFKDGHSIRKICGRCCAAFSCQRA